MESEGKVEQPPIKNEKEKENSKNTEEGEKEEVKPLSIEEILTPSRKRSKVWDNTKTEIEIESGRILYSRDLIKIKFSKKRKYFGKVTQFTTLDASDSYTFSSSVVDPNYTVFKKERSIGVQNIAEKTVQAVQTKRYRKVNKSSQVSTEESLSKKIKEDESDPTKSAEKMVEYQKLAAFLINVEKRVTDVLHQTSILPIFEDDFKELGDTDSFIGKKSESMLKESQSFTHIEYTKNKEISSIDWQPSSKGVIAFNGLKNSTFNEYVQNYGKSERSFVIVWNFSDPIYPQVILKAPCDVTCIKFNPFKTNIIIGGLINGQVCVWDIDEEDTTFQYALKQDIGRDHIKTLNFKQISLIELSHSASVNSIQWLPEQKNYDIYKKELVDPVEESEQEEQNQFLTIAADGKLLLWDMRMDNLPKQKKMMKKKNEKLRDAWIPYHSFNMSHHSDLSDVHGVSFCFQKENPNTIFCTSREGDLIVCDWSKQGLTDTITTKQGSKLKGETPRDMTSPREQQGSLIHSKSTEGGGQAKSKNIVLDSYRTRDGGHFGLAPKIDPHSIFEDIFLTVGDWTVKLWKKNCPKPIWTSPYSDSHVTCGSWSPTKPSVAFIGREDGTIEVWDFLDKSYEPSITFNVSQAKISSIEFRIVTGKSKFTLQYLAVGSSLGTLHIIEVPLNLIRKLPQDESNFRSFLDHEQEKVNYYQERWDIHEQNKMKLEQEKAQQYSELDEDEEEEEEEKKSTKDENVPDINYAQIVKKFQMDLKKVTKEFEAFLK